MIVKRTVHGIPTHNEIMPKNVLREISRNTFIVTEGHGMRSFYSEPAVEHFVCPTHDLGLDSKPCATIQIMGRVR